MHRAALFSEQTQAQAQVFATTNYSGEYQALLSPKPAPVGGGAGYALLERSIPLIGGGNGYFMNAELGVHVPGVTRLASPGQIGLNVSYQSLETMAIYREASKDITAYWQSVDEQLKQEAIMNPRSRFSMGVDHDRIDREEYRRLVNQGLDPRYLLSRRPDVQFTGYGTLVPEVAHAHPDLVMDMNEKLGENVLTLFGFGVTSKIANALGMTGRSSEFAINAASDGLFKGLGYALTEKDPTLDGFSKAVLKGAVYGIASKSLSVKLGNERQLTAALLWGAMGAEDAANQWLQMVMDQLIIGKPLRWA